MSEADTNLSQGRTPCGDQGAEFVVRMPGGTPAVREALQEILTELEPLGFGLEETSTVQLILAEVLNNILEHAYPETGPVGPISISCRHRADGLHFNVTDRGIAMPDGQTPLGIGPMVDVDLMDLPEGGFGWFLIKDLAKDVRYQRVGQENQLDLRIALANG